MRLTRSFYFPVVGVLSSPLLPANLKPRVLSTTRESVTLSRRLALGSPLRFGLNHAHWQLANDPGIRASPGKVTLPHRMPSSFTSVWLCLQISGLAHSRLLVPPHQGHIAGLLFATYTVSTSCFLQTPGYPRYPCLVGVALPSERRAVFFSFRAFRRKSAVRHAGRTSGRR